MRLPSFARLVPVAFLAACSTSGPSSGAPQAAAAPMTTPPSTTYVQPEPGERHLAKIRQLTFGGNNAEAYFSFKGDRIIYQRQEEVDAGCDQQWTMNADGSDQRRVSNGLGRTTCGAWLKGDRQILYSSTFDHERGCPARPDMSQGYVWPLNNLEIYVANADGSNLRRLTDNQAYDAEATISPDGKTILFTSTRDGDIELYTMAIDGSNVRRITNRVGYDGGAWFSPDGKQIIWRAAYPKTAADTADYTKLLAQKLVRPARTEVFVANPDGSGQRQVTNLGGANFAPIFTPDGKKIIFSSNYEKPRSGNFDLFLINPDGTGLEKITTHGDFDSFPMFSPDGKKLLWASNRNQAKPGETNIFIADWVP
jgi:Tol biopolymer transport system component